MQWLIDCKRGELVFDCVWLEGMGYWNIWHLECVQMTWGLIWSFVWMAQREMRNKETVLRLGVGEDDGVVWPGYLVAVEMVWT